MCLLERVAFGVAVVAVFLDGFVRDERMGAPPASAVGTAGARWTGAAGATATSSGVFTVEQRDAVRERVVRLAADDERVVAGALVGSLAGGGGDRFSDVDLAFGVAAHSSVAEVLADWTGTLAGELDAVRLVDLDRHPAVYRVFLLPNALQLDLSLTPAARFRPAGPRVRLLFGTPEAGGQVDAASAGDLFIATPAVAEDVFGWGVVYALHARACVERRRVWQAEHYVGAVRDHALALACLRYGLPPAQARRFDDLPREVLDRLQGSHVAALEPSALRTALAGSVYALLLEAADARLAHGDVVAQRLADLRW